MVNDVSVNGKASMIISLISRTLRLNLLNVFIGIEILLVVNDVSVDHETPTAISLISRTFRLNLLNVFIGIGLPVYIYRMSVRCISKKGKSST